MKKTKSWYDRCADAFARWRDKINPNGRSAEPQPFIGFHQGYKAGYAAAKRDAKKARRK